MLKRVSANGENPGACGVFGSGNLPEIDDSGAAVTIAQADFPAPFKSGLEYGSPARGGWNIVHTGMLIPEAHQIFVCAAGCLRGVVLTAAEMGTQERFSTIAIRENNVLEGDMEELIFDGVGDILSRLKKRPPAVLMYTSCIHHFMGADLKRIYRELRRRYPDVAFTDCYMNPIMRKSGLTPDQLMRRQLYSLLEKRETDPMSVNIIGNDLPTDDNSDIVRLIRASGHKLHEITRCRDYAEYQQMASSALNITTIAAARAGGDELERRLGQKHLYLPVSFDYDKIDANLALLANILGIDSPDTAQPRAKAEEALSQAKIEIGGAPIAIDYTMTSRPLGLAKLLISHGFNVTALYADSLSAEEKDSFDWLKINAPGLILRPTVHAKMRVLPRGGSEKLLAIGQKAAYFTGSDYFVNIIEDGGMYGYDGIARLAGLMREAFTAPKDARSLIQIKGMGCGCCL